MKGAYKTQTTGASVVLEMLLAGGETVEVWRAGLEDFEAMLNQLKDGEGIL